jgi:hypothetical protein
MKNLNYVILSSFILLFHSLNLKAQSRFDVWPELKAFHTVMSQTFHPSEEGNLEPIKTRSAEMVSKADVLATSKLPKEFNKKEVKDAVLKIAIDSKKLHELIQQKASDKMISNALEDLHNTFHLIVEKCSKKEEHH